MIDRNGKPLNVGWSFLEREWLRAAYAYTGDRTEALRDFCELTGRTMAAARSAACIYGFAKSTAPARRDRPCVPVPGLTAIAAVPIKGGRERPSLPRSFDMAPSELRQPTAAERMGRRSWVVVQFEIPAR